MTNFKKEYWDKNYSEPDTMDCIGNSDEHVNYLYSIFNLEKIDISSIVDLGMGHGVLFREVMAKFIPYKAYGIEPSSYIFKKVKKESLRPVESTNLVLKNITIQKWLDEIDGKKQAFDLALCNSVFQYIESEDLDLIVQGLSKHIKYLYLTVPTDKELKKQVSDLEFDDEYAIARSRSFYQKLMKKHFTCVSSRLWESKYFFNEKTSLFSDLLYRY